MCERELFPTSGKFCRPWNLQPGQLRIRVPPNYRTYTCPNRILGAVAGLAATKAKCGSRRSSIGTETHVRTRTLFLPFFMSCLLLEHQKKKKRKFLGGGRRRFVIFLGSCSISRPPGGVSSSDSGPIG